MSRSTINQKSGLTLVEVVIASAIILVAVVSLIAVHTLYLKTALSNSQSVKAAYLAEEGIEAMRYLRDDSWAAKIAPLVSGVDYGLALSLGTWVLSAGSDWTLGIERRVRLGDVYRDASGDVVSSGGTLDPGTRLVVSSVSWFSRGATTTKSISTYLTNLNEN